MYAQGTRNTSGDGTAIVVASATERLQLGEFIQLQLTETGPVTVLLKLGSTTIYSVMLTDSGDGVVLQRIPPITGARGDDLLVNLSAEKAVAFVIAYSVLTTY